MSGRPIYVAQLVAAPRRVALARVLPNSLSDFRVELGINKSLAALYDLGATLATRYT